MGVDKAFIRGIGNDPDILLVSDVKSARGVSENMEVMDLNVLHRQRILVVTVTNVFITVLLI